jgi:hypothetical protein
MPTGRRKIRYAVVAILAAAIATVVAWAWYDSTLGNRYIQYHRLSYQGASLSARPLPGLRVRPYRQH